MVLVEGTFWPLVVIGALPNSTPADDAVTTVDETLLWSAHDLRFAVVISGNHSHAWMAQEEVFAWLSRHRERLWECASRVAWIFEDESTRRSTERWLTLVGDRLFRGEVTTFRSVRAAVCWLVQEDTTPLPPAGGPALH